MDTIIRQVRDLPAAERAVAEQLVGHALSETQQLVIQIVELEPSTDTGRLAAGSSILPDWCNVYKGLSDAEIAAVEAVVLTRADLTRSPR